MDSLNRTTPAPARDTAGTQNPAVLESKRRAALLMQAVVGIAISNGTKDYKALADKAGMTRPQVSNYARGKSQPSLENFMRLAAAAGAKISVTNARKSETKSQ